MGRNKKYTPKTLRQAVDAYLRRISRTETLRDEDGNEVLNDDKQPVEVRRFLVPPSVTALCMELGIDRRSWARYANEEGYADAVEHMRMTIETYLEGELLTRRKGIQGVIFALQNRADGWSHKVDAGEDTRRAMAAAAPLGEKLALLRELYEGTRDGSGGAEKDGENPPSPPAAAPPPFAKGGLTGLEDGDG